ncbi:MAG: imelysin family protein [Myxococcales bacterium]|nr:imelysin family protein [Myxococcales bacterium]
MARHTDWKIRLTAAVVTALVASCAGPKADPGQDPADIAAEQALLKALASDVIGPSIAVFADKTATLDGLVKTWCASSDPSADPSLQAAQTGWLAAAQAWHHLLPMAIGPHADTDTADAIYSWPLINACAVDQGVAMLHKDAKLDVTAGLPNRKGIDALETLLFRASLQTTCPAQAQPEGWKDLTDPEKVAARCAYAEKVAAALNKRALALKTAWATDGGDYGAQLAGDNKTWKSSHAALNALSDAVLSLETDVKGRRLGAPLGIADNPCGTVGVACSKAVEAPWAQKGATLLKANLAGARDLLLGIGDNGQGFDDWLVRKGAQPAATELRAKLDAARDALNKVPDPLQDTLKNKQALVKAAYDAIGQLTHHIETQLLVALALEVPASVAGDAD